MSFRHSIPRVREGATLKKFHWLLGASFVGLAAVIAAPAAHADHDVNFGVNVPIRGDQGLFFSISSRYFDRDAEVVNNWGRRYPDPDDLAVFLYICSKSSEKPEGIDYYRRKGLSWYDVGVRAGVPADAWYVAVDRNPGGRYSRPYGQWNRYKQDPRHVVKLSDHEVRDLVAVRMSHEYYGVTPEIAMNWRRSGADVRTIMTREYRSRHQGEWPDNDRYAPRYDGRRDDYPGDRH
jgi:hypothetical protein